MEYVLGMASLLFLAWANYRLGFNKGYVDGYEKGANKVVDEWRKWLENVKEKE